MPDLITTAKGIAGGLPLAAVTGRAEVMDAVHVGGLGGTYGGNPVACAAALGAIEEMRTHDLGARARAIEALIRAPARGARRRPPGHRRHPRPRRDDGDRAVSSPAPLEPGRRPRGRGRGVLPPATASSPSPAAPGATSSASCPRSRSATSCSRRRSTSSPRRSPPPPEGVRSPRIRVAAVPGRPSPIM